MPIFQNILPFYTPSGDVGKLQLIHILPILSHFSYSDEYVVLSHGEFFLLKYSWFTMLCQSLLYSTVTQFYTYIHSFFNILFHYGLSQEIGYSSLCCTVRPCCLSILNIIVCIYQLQIPSPSLSLSEE